MSEGMDRFISRPAAAPATKLLAFRNKPSMPFDAVPTPYGKFLLGDHPFPLRSIAVNDGVPDSNVARAVRAATKDSGNLLVALPARIRRLEDRADAFITLRQRSTERRERERDFHAANRADIRKLQTDITTLLQLLREQRNFWFQAVKDECGLANKDEVVGDLLFAAAGLAVQMRDELIITKRSLTAAMTFLSAHNKAVAQMDAEEDLQHSPRPQKQETGRDELHNDRIGHSDGPSHIVDDERSALHGRLSAPEPASAPAA